MDVWYVLVAAGLVCGVVSALFGVGSGIIMVPLLALLFQFSQKSAQGISLAVMVPMALAGALRYRLNPEVDMPSLKILLLALGGVMGAVAGAHIVRHVPSAMLRKGFALFVIVVGVRMLVTPEQPAKRAPQAPAARPAEETPPA